ncbi:MAG: hypothetical protein KGL39_39720 [Patescibacteria group bacterium]|nr:hypothetical protein [Patescibacteria group bacterium]
MPRTATDPELPKVNLNSFIGGESIDLKNGLSGGFYSSLGLDFREKASQTGVLPGMKQLSNTLSDKITAMDQDLAGIRYAAGDQGHVYKIDGSNTISSLGTLDSNGAAGLVYNPQTDNCYIASQQSISLYGQCTNGNVTPSLQSAQFGQSASVAPSVIYTFNTTTSSYDGGTVSGVTTQRNNLNTLTTTAITPSNYASLVTNPNSGTYMPLTSITETSGNFTSFIPDIEPMAAIAVYLTAKGTGNLTLTLHDSQNNKLAQVTINNASLTAGWNLFTFTTPGVRAFINAIQSNTTSTGYHFHLTSSVGSDTMRVGTIANGDISGANFVYFAHRMVQTENGWHPMKIFNQYLCIGNGNYLSTYNFGNDSGPNNQQYVRHQLLLDVGYEITGLENAGTYLVITAGRTSSSGTRQYQGGYIYLWDGINSSFNLKVPVPNGTPYSPYCNNNVVYFFCNGSFFAYAPGAPTVNKVRYIGYQNTNFLNAHDTTVCNPNMMCMRYNVLHMAYPTSTTNTNLNMGIYSWGSVELIYPNSFAYSFISSTQMQNTSGTYNSVAYSAYEIGMIQNFVDEMYMSYQYTQSGTTYYCLDILDNTCGLAKNFNMTLLMWDGSARWKQKELMRVKVNFTALPSGVTLTPWYSLDRGSQITQDSNNNSFQVGAGATEAFINIPINNRVHEIQCGFIGAVTGTVMTTPQITGFAFEVNPHADENDLRPDG